MRLNKYLMLILVLLLAVSCEYQSATDTEAENEIGTEKPDIKITIGTICGWCVGSDTLFITEKKMSYVHAAVCEGTEYRTSKPTPDSVWNKIIDLYNQDDFAKIDINTCRVCADGCDTWIKVENGTFTHKIRFGSIRDSEALKTIEDFIDLLANEKDKFEVQ
ncbi:MAG: hypothetical protein EOM47_12890 [Bacteroidia bacterium]|nr:hypothetical protein [Bacteroidia bacterium]